MARRGAAAHADHVDHERRPPADLDLAAAASAPGSLPAHRLAGAHAGGHIWTPVLDIPDDEFWEVRRRNKRTLLAYLHEYARRRWASGEIDPKQVVSSGPFLQPEPLTIGFARRFATYKRATLMFSDPDRLARILTNPERPVQLIFAGKAHPADDGGKRLIQEIFWRSIDPRFQGRISFAEDYDMLLASRLYSGVDVWLNNPRAPLEASGTSGMKAAANGALNLSVLDGWWIEGFAANPDTGGASCHRS